MTDTDDQSQMVEERLLAILEHLSPQTEAGAGITRDLKPFDEAVAGVRSWIVDHGEYGLAQEAMICWMEAYPFTVSGSIAVKLAELVLITGFKTDYAKDAVFDRNASFGVHSKG